MHIMSRAYNAKFIQFASSMHDTFDYAKRAEAIIFGGFYYKNYYLAYFRFVCKICYLI